MDVVEMMEVSEGCEQNLHAHVSSSAQVGVSGRHSHGPGSGVFGTAGGGGVVMDKGEKIQSESQEAEPPQCFWW